MVPPVEQRRTASCSLTWYTPCVYNRCTRCKINSRARSTARARSIAASKKRALYLTRTSVMCRAALTEDWPVLIDRSRLRTLHQRRQRCGHAISSDAYIAPTATTFAAKQNSSPISGAVKHVGSARLDVSTALTPCFHAVANIRLNTIQSKPAGGVGNERNQWAGIEEHKGCRQDSVCVNHRGQQERLELPLSDPISGFLSSPLPRAAGAAACPELQSGCIVHDWSWPRPHEAAR